MYILKHFQNFTTDDCHKCIDTMLIPYFCKNISPRLHTYIYIYVYTIPQTPFYGKNDPQSEASIQKEFSSKKVRNCRPLDKFTLTGVKRWLGAGYGFGKFGPLLLAFLFTDDLGRVIIIIHLQKENIPTEKSLTFLITDQGLKINNLNNAG